eukprot:scaffold998_cov411-Prasinococcus_capsulatus_cf.AAC.16
MSGRTLYLDWKPLTRDCTFYSLAILGIIFIFRDGIVEYWEGIISVVCYCCYIVFMLYNEVIQLRLDSDSMRTTLRIGAGQVILEWVEVRTQHVMWLNPHEVHRSRASRRLDSAKVEDEQKNAHPPAPDEKAFAEREVGHPLYSLPLRQEP